MVISLASYTYGTVGPSEVCDMRGHIRNKGARIRNDDEASVEGMPLYMLIMVVVVEAVMVVVATVVHTDSFTEHLIIGAIPHMTPIIRRQRIS